MKKLILALVIISVFAACKKDEDEEVKPDYALITLTINATDKYPVSGNFTYFVDNEHRDTILKCDNLTDTLKKEFKVKIKDSYILNFYCPNPDNIGNKWSIKHHTVHPKREFEQTFKPTGSYLQYSIIP